jgi:hypothetical protein
MKPFYLLAGILFLFLISACTDGSELILVPDNNSPPDDSVPEVVMETWVNKVYISLLGRKATDVEFSGAMDMLKQENASVAKRKAVLEVVIVKPEFKSRMFDVARTEMLNNLDMADIPNQIALLQILLNDPNYAPFISLIQYEIDRLNALLDIPAGLASGAIDRKEMHRRCADNYYYDQVNMGSLNFVLSLFEYFLKRNPTESETEAAVRMADGFESLLFLETGASKDDLLHIFFDSDDYLEGEVINVYNDYLFRQPTSVEMSEGTLVYRQSGKYEDLIKSVLSSDDFMGI